MNILGPVGGRVGNESPLIQGVGRDLNFETERFEMFPALFDPVRKNAGSAPGGADDAYDVTWL